MALIACPECGHKISSLARFCPKCSPAKKNTERDSPGIAGRGSLGDGFSGKVLSRNDILHGDAASGDELLPHQFTPSPDERIILEGRAFLVEGLFNIRDGYAYLTSKRYAVCDASRVNIVFQVGRKGIVFVEEGRHLISKKITITTVSGETCQVKSQPHIKWLHALLDSESIAAASKKPGPDPLDTGSGNPDWYYETAGITIGPVKERFIVQLIQNNHTIFRNTKVWNATMTEWKRAEDTILTIYFCDPATYKADSTRATAASRMYGHPFFLQIGRLFRKYF